MEQNKVSLTELDASNWYECCQLNVSKEQEAFIESNAISIAQSKFETTLRLYGISLNEKIVGFLMFNTVKEELEGYWIYRIMIDKNYQGKGIAKLAVQLLISRIAELPDANKVIVGYHPDNQAAHHLYTSIGFVDNGDRFGKEMAVIKNLE
ncbi:GNAT family N-acetyltransferase [Terribacillus saccharophilus]|uniref:N-acetyltransferase n=1 Tax=Terribacillus saccharophilus TaxID=361277 RepID=A0ABX4GVX9_9BACI|nr:GNAT family N-acetyltransferase [Terribacillus saccharophilus]PAD34709.1 N-acetyltransferase [Terribacillus saccharophilus]PAD95457.1 N-acetyltransferase [Terribacillus saccharophilus]PAD99035.1 N-acetyltransferase [Terribacillus saccharophilus]